MLSVSQKDLDSFFLGLWGFKNSGNTWRMVKRNSGFIEVWLKTYFIYVCSTAISSAEPSKEPANYRGLVDAYILCAEEGYEALGLRGQVLPSEQDGPAGQKIKTSLSNVLDACISFTYEAFCKKYPELSHDIIVSKVTPLFLEAKQHVPYDDIIQRLTEFRISSLLSKYNPEPKLDWTSPKRNRKKK